MISSRLPWHDQERAVEGPEELRKQLPSWLRPSWLRLSGLAPFERLRPGREKTMADGQAEAAGPDQTG